MSSDIDFKLAFIGVAFAVGFCGRMVMVLPEGIMGIIAIIAICTTYKEKTDRAVDKRKWSKTFFIFFLIDAVFCMISAIFAAMDLMTCCLIFGFAALTMGMLVGKYILAIKKHYVWAATLVIVYYPILVILVWICIYYNPIGILEITPSKLQEFSDFNDYPYAIQKIIALFLWFPSVAPWVFMDLGFACLSDKPSSSKASKE